MLSFISGSAKKIIRLLLFIIGIAVLISFIALASVFLLTKYKGDLVCSLAESQLQQATDFFWRLDAVQPSLFPPGIFFDSIRVYEDSSAARNDKAVFSVKSLLIEPDVVGFFSGHTGIKRLILDSPIFILKEGEEPQIIEDKTEVVRDLAREKKLIDAEEFDKLEELQSKTAAKVAASFSEKGLADEKLAESSGVLSGEKSGRAEFDKGDLKKPPLVLQRADDKYLNMNRKELEYQRLLKKGMSEAKKFMSRRIRRKIRQLQIKNASFEHRTADESLLLSVTGIEAELNTRPRKESSLHGHLYIPELEFELDLDLKFRIPRQKSEYIFLADLSLIASIKPPESRVIKGKLDLELKWQREDDFIIVDNLHIQAEGDELKAKLTFDPRDLSLVGPLNFGSLSLPRWFYFARNLPPGLQECLHSLSGTARAYISPFEAHAFDIVASVGDLSLAGEVGAADFSNPVVKVALDMEFADVDRLFPFLSIAEDNIPDPLEPQFDISYLIPFPGPAGADAPDVSYDVRVRAEKSRMHSLPTGPVLVTVVPFGETLTRVDVDAENYAEGRVKGRLDIDVNRTDMNFDLMENNLGLLPENKGSSVLFGGYVSGRVSFEVPVKNTVWNDEWKIQIKGSIKDHSIKLAGENGWGFIAKKADIEGTGLMHTVRSDGIKMVGLWKIKSDELNSTWHPEAKDKINIALDGTIAWPEISEDQEAESSGIDRIYGKLNAKGGVILPLGQRLIPLNGLLISDLDWDLGKGILQLPDAMYEGMDSVSTGFLKLDSSGKETVFTGVQNFKISPRTVLKAWSLLPDAIQVPKLMQGKTNFRADSKNTIFSKLSFQADGAPVKGSVTVVQPEARPRDYSNLLFDIDLQADRIDFDNYLPPDPPEMRNKPSSKEPWNLSVFEGIDLHYKLFLDKARFRKVTMNETQAEGKLDRGQFNLTWLSSDLYTGRATCQLEGFLNVKKSTLRLDKGNTVFKGVNLSGAFSDMGDYGQKYGGTADMVFDVSGLMGSNADFPGALSGRWSLEVRDGLFPAFMGSESAGLRNTFSRARMHGEIFKGVMKSDNFTLKGSMVSMSGKGIVDLGLKNLDVDVDVTVAGIPTIPVKFAGPFSKMEMKIGGDNVVLGTAQAAGGTIFNLFMGVLELPAKAVMGVGDLFKGKTKVEKKVYKTKNQ